MHPYRGRFAPSPTGPLHFGSLFAAVVSWAHARSHQGEWHVRIEDLDPPREQPGASEHILHCLSAHGLTWDGLSYQSQHTERYQHTLQSLIDLGAVYACPCSRKDLNSHHAQHRSDCPRPINSAQDCALRFRSRTATHDWRDGFRGHQSFPVEQDFVLRRRDRLWAYQLAVVADDHAQGITHVVRGADLLNSTPMQLALYHAMAWSAPEFSHFAIITKDHQKLSKQNHAPPVDTQKPVANLLNVVRHMGLPLQGLTPKSALGDVLHHLLEHWQNSPVLSANDICQADH